MQIVVLICHSGNHSPWQIAVPGEQGEVQVDGLDEYLHSVNTVLDTWQGLMLK